jgi:hypothetical protein
MKASNGVYAPFDWLDDNSYVTKTGEVVYHFRLRGIDFECMTGEELEARHGRLVNAFLSMPNHIRQKYYLRKEDRVTLPETHHENPTVKRTLETRRQFLLNRPEPLHGIDTFLALVYEPKRFFQASQSGAFKVSRRNIRKAQEVLKETARNLQQTVNDLLGMEPMTREETFQFLRYLTTLDQDIAATEPLRETDSLDALITGEQLHITRRGVQLGAQKPVVMTMRAIPESTFPNVLREILSINGNFLLHTEFKREERDASLSHVRKAENWWKYMKYLKDPRALIELAAKEGDTEGMKEDPTASEREEECGQIAKQIVNGETYGFFSFSAIAYGPDAAKNDKTALSLRTVVGNQLGSLIRESGTYAAAPFLNLVPGTTPKYGTKFRKRSRRLPLSQFVDLALIYNHSRGQAINHVTRRKALMQVVSSDGTLIDFNLIPPDAEYTGVVMCGKPGSGKSTAIKALIDNGMKDDPYVLILDGISGGGYRMLTRKHAGVFFDLDPEGDWGFTLNPLDVADTKKNRRIVTALVETCMSTGGYKRNARYSLEIYKEVSRILAEGKPGRKLSDLHLSERLAPYLAQWRGEGEYAFVFDNPQDTLRLSKFQTIDFTKLSEFPDVVQPLLFHIFHHWDQIIYRDDLLTTPKRMFVDEGWELIRYKTAKRYIVRAGRTWRKKLGEIVLGSQSTAEWKEAGILPIIRELCPMAILLSNPNGNPTDYAEVFKLNEEELRLYGGLNQVGAGLVKSSSFSKVIHLPIDPQALWCYRDDPFSNEKRSRALEKYGDLNEALAALAEGVA